jgi:ectoine hydroxylase-related dioxygenase (phytanoyl-CoA dioxygenase family)
MASREATMVARSNGVPIGFDDRYFAPMRDSTSLLDRPAGLRDRFEDDGYLLLRGVLDPELVRSVRAAYFAAFPPAYFKPGTTPADGVYAGHTPPSVLPHGVAGHPAHAFVRSEVFAAFADQPVLADLAAMILDHPVFRLRRTPLRHFDSASGLASRAHTDQAYLSEEVSGADTVTIWIPLGDCPIESGSVVYLSGSHRVDLRAAVRQHSPVTDRPDDPRPFSHDLAWTARVLGGRWLWTDFLAGDVTVHRADLLHASLDTTTEVMRLSTDLRFQRTGTPTDARWMTDWSADDGA